LDEAGFVTVAAMALGLTVLEVRAERSSRVHGVWGGVGLGFLYPDGLTAVASGLNLQDGSTAGFECSGRVIIKIIYYCVM
jgi:hypothetical protein